MDLTKSNLGVCRTEVMAYLKKQARHGEPKIGPQSCNNFVIMQALLVEHPTGLLFNLGMLRLLFSQAHFSN